MCIDQNVLNATTLLANAVRIGGTIPAVPVVRTIVPSSGQLQRSE